MRSLLVSSDTAIPVAPNVTGRVVAAPRQPMASIASLKVTPSRSLRASAPARSSMPAQTTRPRTADPRTFAAVPAQLVEKVECILEDEDKGHRSGVSKRLVLAQRCLNRSSDSLLRAALCTDLHGRTRRLLGPGGAFRPILTLV